MEHKKCREDFEAADIPSVYVGVHPYTKLWSK